MKKFFMRAPASPFENPRFLYAVTHNQVMSNSGNLLFPHSIARTLMLPDVEIDFGRTAKTFSAEDAKRIDETYDAFLIPLANAFRPTFIKELNNLTFLVKHLHIPCIVISVGYQDELDYGLTQNKELDHSVTDFVRAVLEKSSILGVRGDITASYLNHLGFTPEKDYTVIGCPSMFLYGAELPKPRSLHLNEQTRISLNGKVFLPDALHEYLQGIYETYPNCHYVVQNNYELNTVLLGTPIQKAAGKKMSNIYPDYPADYSHKLYRENKVCGFVTAEAWFSYLREKDLSTGSRIHGNIAAVLSGTPAFVTAPDSRVLELARYHNIPHIPLSELQKNKSLEQLVSKVNFNSVLDGHTMRFQKYLDFLHQNDLDTIYDHTLDSIPFDAKIANVDFLGGVRPFPFADYDDQLEIINYYQKQAKKNPKPPESFLQKCKRRLKKIMKKR